MALRFFCASAFCVYPTFAYTDSLPTVSSINLCTDQLVLLLAKPEQILSVSTLSHEEAGSYLYEQARKYPANKGSSEQILKLSPDLVLAGQYTTQATVKLLRELGFTVEIIPIANSLEDVITNIEFVASLLGRPEHGEAITTQMEERVKEIVLKNSALTNKPVAAFYDPNGYTVGPATLRGEVLELAGWENAAKVFGIEHYGTMPLESLISVAPDALIESPYSEGTYSRGQQLLKHPALRKSGD